MQNLTPPHDFASESALIGSLVVCPDTIPEVLAIVPHAADFYDEGHALIFEAVTQAWDSHYPGQLDLVLVQNRLRNRGVYDRIGGDQRLSDIANGVPSGSNAPHYARIVADKAKLRRLIDVCDKTKHDAYHVGGSGPDSVREVLDEHEAAIFGLGEATAGAGAKPLGRLVQAQMDRIDRADTSTPMGTPSGFGVLDAKTQGFQDGEVTIVAARPSMGKTAWGLNVVESIGLAGTPVGVFSLEMGDASIAQRFMSARSGVDSTLIRSGVIGIDMGQLVRAAAQLSEAPIYIDDASSLTVMELRARARRMVKQYGVRVLVIDYLQLLTDPTSRRDGRFVEVSAISRGVKALAREMKIPIVLLAQLNRNAEAREGNKPRMADLALSGSIEQDADVILLLHREEYYHVQDPSWADQNYDKVGLAEVIIAKNRNGPTGVVELTWDAKATRFKNRAG